MKIKINKKSGYSLIELLVSVFIFSIIVIPTISALVIVVDISDQAKLVKKDLDKISLISNLISRSGRTAYDVVYPATGSNIDGFCLENINKNSINLNSREAFYFKAEVSSQKFLFTSKSDECRSTFPTFTDEDNILPKIKQFNLESIPSDKFLHFNYSFDIGNLNNTPVQISNTIFINNRNQVGFVK